MLVRSRVDMTCMYVYVHISPTGLKHILYYYRYRVVVYTRYLLCSARCPNANEFADYGRVCCVVQIKMVRLGSTFEPLPDLWRKHSPNKLTLTTAVLTT